MKYFCVFLISLVCYTLRGQEIKGVCVDNAGNRIEYVNIGVKGSYVGTISDGHGAFNIEIPDSLLSDSLTFSHISYRPKTIALADLRVGSATGASADGMARIALEESSFDVAAVEVKPWKSKLRTLNAMGMRFPGGAAVFWRRPEETVPQTEETRRQMPPLKDQKCGVIIDLKEKAWIKGVELDIIKNTFDSLRFRIVVYRVEGEGPVEENKFEPMMDKPYYMDVSVSEKKMNIVCDLSEMYIVAQCRVYVGFEFVEAGRFGRLDFPLHLGGDKLYYKNMATGMLEKDPINLGLRVKGVTM